MITFKQAVQNLTPENFEELPDREKAGLTQLIQDAEFVYLQNQALIFRSGESISLDYILRCYGNDPLLIRLSYEEEETLWKGLGQSPVATVQTNLIDDYPIFTGKTLAEALELTIWKHEYSAEYEIRELAPGFALLMFPRKFENRPTKQVVLTLPCEINYIELEVYNKNRIVLYETLGYPPLV